MSSWDFPGADDSTPPAGTAGWVPDGTVALVAC
jgi:hypothetical protein